VTVDRELVQLTDEDTAILLHNFIWHPLRDNGCDKDIARRRLHCETFPIRKDIAVYT